ncbi:major facilitator superfamily protein [Clostridium tepidiprofundi DSM 19306]|uniref:Major facilitator superfamily protein n=1 Tax=Clostridium tepidiprofundi DSM 19306 TaxID=1121338 RepID=A0A151ASA5_9CLOT|nr:MFS transporter [Clostridium tepidiprofundi]KYH30534.1 major facilitator superfamily protein [Clostridium tepidiprofundi DSM 19306]
MNQQYINKNIDKNIDKYLIYVTLSRALFYLPIFVIFYKGLGVPYGVVMIFFSVLSIVKFLLEVPTGSFADNIGRKKILAISLIFKIISLFILSILALFLKNINIEGYILIIISTVCFGIGEVLESGTADALVYDYLKFYNKEEVFKNVTAKANSLIFMVFSVSGIIGGGLYSINRSLPYIFTLLAFILAFIAILSFNEINLENKTKKKIKFFNDNYITIIRSFRNIKTKKYLINIMFYGAFLFSYFMLVNWQLQILFKYININVALFGIIFCVLNLISSIFARLYPYVEKYIDIKATLFFIAIIFSLVYISIYFVKKSFAIILLSIILYALWGYSVPLYSNLLNKNINSETRATMISIQSLLKSIFYAILSPLLGFLVDVYSIRNTFFITGIMIFITLIIPLVPIKNVTFKDENNSINI